MSPRFPEFGEKLLRERTHQVANAFRSTGARLHPEHSLDHQNVVIAPERDILIVLDEQVLHYEKIRVRLRMRQDLDDRLNLFFAGLNLEAAASEQTPESIV